MSISTHAINPMVEYLNSLRTQQQESNATYVHEARREFVRELRATAPWFPEESQLHVRTKLDQLAVDLSAERIQLRILFLTGDAGDGKTAFCAQLARELRHEAELTAETVMGNFLVIKDASEVDEKLLRQRILAHLVSEPPSTLVVAINEGRLRRVFRGLQGKEPHALWNDVVQPALESWADEQRVSGIDAAMRASRVMVINFRHRFHVRSVAPALLALWTEPTQWETSPACTACPKRVECPMLANVADLRKPRVQEGIANVLAWSHFSGQRLPFRRLQAVLALATTGGLRCNDLQVGALRHEPSLGLLRHRYYHALFLRNEIRTPVRVRPEPIAQAFTRADPGRFVDPVRDDDLYRQVAAPMERDPEHATAKQTGSLETAAVEGLRRGLDPASNSDVRGLQEDIARTIRYLRQLSQFERDVSPRLSWLRALQLLEQQASGADAHYALQRAVVEALNRLHRVEEVKRETITGNQIDPAGLRVPSRQVLELNLGTEFSVGVECGPVAPDSVRPYVETVPSEIHLTAWPVGSAKTTSSARLRLDARLVDILLNVLDGFSGWQGLGPFRRDLARFHGRLMTLAAETGRKPAVTIRAGERRYGVSTDTTGGRPKFRLEGRG